METHPMTDASQSHGTEQARPFVLDKTGREILVGDVLKIEHFTGPRRKKYYMHKWIESEATLGPTGQRNKFFKVSHLGVRPEHYHLRRDGRILPDTEIVQGYGEDGTAWYDRPKLQPHPAPPSRNGATEGA